MSVAVALACVAVALVAAAVQGSIGLGFGLVASPVLAIVDTDFVPGAVLIAVLPLSTSVTLSSLDDVDRRSAALALAGRVPGVVVGAAIAAAVSARALSIGLSVAVLVAIALTLRLPSVRTTPGLTISAGAVSGFMATTTGVGGPPMALLWQRWNPDVVRATLSAYFAIGTVLSLAALAVAGDLSARQWRLGALLIPGVLGGLAASHWLRRYVGGPWFRPVLLAVCAASAVVLMVEQV